MSPDHNPDANDRIDKLFRATGEVTIVWAYLELAFDSWLNVIHHEWGGKDCSTELPRTAFNKKTNYLRKWWNSNETNQIVFPMIPEIADKLDNLADLRHWVIHGVVDDFQEYIDSGSLTLARRDKKEPNRTWKVEVDIEKLTELRTHIFQMAAFLGSSIHIFSDPENASDDPFRDLVVKLSRHLKDR